MFNKNILLKPSTRKRFFFFFFSDIIISILTLYIAFLLRFNFSIPDIYFENYTQVLILFTITKLTSLVLFDNYSIIWRFYGLNEAKKLVLALMTSATVLILVHFFYPSFFNPFPRSVFIIDLLLSIILFSELRFAKRLFYDPKLPNKKTKSTLLIGISNTTPNFVQTSTSNSSEYEIKAIIAIQEQNKNMIGSSISNIKIFDASTIATLIELNEITCAIIDGSLPDEEIRQMYQQLTNLNIYDIKRTALLAEEKEFIRSFTIEDLLARHPKDLDTTAISNFIKGKIVLVTGAGGSIGSEISLQCHQYGASQLILVDHSEYNLYQIGEKLPLAQLHLCNITHVNDLNTIMCTSKPDIVIHAAAYKHVPLCESNMHAAIMNNIIGSRNVIDSAIAHDIKKIVIISTDKAVRPTNVMGTTKRIVELYAQNVNPRNSEIVAVRFGNVLGSSGSVIPKFKAQIEAGGPITLTHPDITRYFMLISEACQLVLQAAAIAKGKELFILDMGEPVKIIDLAHSMIRLYAPQPIEIITSGLRPGEKLYEELLLDESEQKTTYESILIAGSTFYPIEQLNNDIDSLIQSDNPIELLKRIVPEFIPTL